MSTISDLKTSYCVYWIPCITHSEPQAAVGNIQDSYESADGVWIYDVKSCVSIPHTPDGLEVIIKLHIKETSKRKSSDNYEYDVELRSVEHSRNGMICFRYVLPAFDEVKFNEPLRNKIYSQIKGHFHTHLYHPIHGGLKKGYYSEDPEKCHIHAYDNEALIFYLQQISDIVAEEAAFLLDESKELKFDYTPTDSTDALKYRESLSGFLGRCQNLLGQFTFFSSLLNSKWNRSCTLDHLATADDDAHNDSASGIADLHELAHNIYNTKESLDRIHAKVQSAFYLTNIHRHYDLQQEIKKLAQEIQGIASSNNDIASSNLKLATESKNLAKENKELAKESERSNRISSRLGWLSLIITIVLGSISIWQGCSEKSLSREEIHQIATQIQQEQPSIHPKADPQTPEKQQ